MLVMNLYQPTIFADLNKKESQAPDFARTTLNIDDLKYKHIRAALKFPEIDQMHQLMLMLTGLTENDIGELSPQDAATLTLTVQEHLMKFNQPAN